ncbi:Kinesin KP1 [Hibiscus syriacus]|uniref:Kinesin KP1 n=1 Tax=Hibiscus syriacus TaxID=106335 RepID=A0A6A2W9R5_HIBSY|nr:Kinesin KP1 [Hibiscus syriacus]
MPQETNSNPTFTSPSKNLRGLETLASNNVENSPTHEDIFNDYGLALRKAKEAAERRYQAAQWLREMEQDASESLPKEPTEEEFCLALRNGLILCNVLNKVNPGAVLKIVENPIIPEQLTEGAAQSAIQYFENMRNFLVAVKDMQLLTFEASDVEKGGSMNKVVDCILFLKGYYEWKQAGGIGVWRYGGTVKIMALPKGSPPSLIGSESADDSLDGSESSQYEQLLEFLHLSNEVAIEESKTANALAFLFDRFGLWLIQAYVRESNEIEELPLNAMLIDTLISKIVKDFSALLVSQGTQLGLFLKKILKADLNSLSKSDFIEAISMYLGERTSVASNDFFKFCICGGKREAIHQTISHSNAYTQLIHLQQRELKDIKLDFQETKLEVKQIHSNWARQLERLAHHIKGLEVASSSHQKVLEENRLLYNQVQDLKGTIRVYCRVRPFLQGQENGQLTVDYIGENGNIMISNPLKQGKDARKVFSFNKVFGPNVTQEQIYIDTQPLIRSVLDGFNVCIFAYGQTGSGKTYTMSGQDLTTEQTWGVNYRALRDLFQISKERADMVKYEFTLTIRTLDIRNNSQLNGLNVLDASWVPVSSTRDVLELMRIGQKNRAVGTTALNERSSRSHSVLTVHVYGKELVSGSILKGCLHLVDLAGNERVDKSEAVGDRLKEAQHINRSLSALGDVISALAQKSAHIPYRNSKLTQVLQDSLGGQAKTLMCVHISPEVNAIGETISTLKFAERISNLKLALEKKEAEVEQIKAGNVRSMTESQRGRAVSPFQIPRNGIPEATSRSSSSGKQRRSRFPSAFADKESLPKMAIPAEDRLARALKVRSPSPPVRRSLSTDRGASNRSRIKADMVDNQPVSKVQFPARVPVNKSFATTNVTPSSDANSSGVHSIFQEAAKQENISDALYNLRKLSINKVRPEHEDEQFRQALNVRQGEIRKSKAESKAKMKHQLPAMTLLSEMDAEEASKSDFSEPEYEQSFVGSPMHAALKMKKPGHKFSRNSHNIEQRGFMQPQSQAVVPPLGRKTDRTLTEIASVITGKLMVRELCQFYKCPYWCKTMDIATNGGWSLSWIEGKVLTFDESEAGELDGRRLALLGKIIADKPQSKGGVQGVFRRVWGEWRDITITELSENTYLFTFKEARAAEQILEEGPCGLRVQIHGLSLDQMSPKNAKKVGDQIGRVLEIEDPISSHGIRRGFFRIRVLKDVSKPLPLGFWASRVGKSNIWDSFKYEHLADFCYKCGCDSHVDVHCIKDTVMSIPDPSLPKYGLWMRANPSVSSMKALAEMEKSPHKAKQVMGRITFVFIASKIVLLLQVLKIGTPNCIISQHYGWQFGGINGAPSSATSRRYQAAEWLRQMNQVVLEFLPKAPTEEEFRRALYNGFILCNILNKVSADVVPKVVKTSFTFSQLTEEDRNQVSENMRNFLAAVKDKHLLAFEASDMEKGDSINKVVDCILCLKGYHEWKKAGGVGVWREESELSKYEQLRDFIYVDKE